MANKVRTGTAGGPEGAPVRHTPLSRVGCVTTSMQVSRWCGGLGGGGPRCGGLVTGLLKTAAALHGRLVTVRPKGSMRVRCGWKGPERP